LDYRAGITQHFGVLFDDESGASDPFYSKWQWYPALYSLAGEDVLKIDEVTRLTVGHVFTHLAFLKDLDYKRRTEAKK
jgi:hypothetical protein